MCLAIPAKVKALYENKRALIDIGGVTREISVALLDKVEVGEFVIVHVGYALSKLDQIEAEKTLKLFDEIL